MMTDAPNEGLSMWTVYDHPTDFPHCFVARRFVSDRAGPRPTTDVLTAPELVFLRKYFLWQGLTVLCRDPNDDPKIVEVWL